MIIRARRTHDHSLQRVQADSDRRTEESAALSEAREYLEEYERLVEHLKKHIPEDFFKKQRLSFSRTSLNLLDFIAVSALLAVALGIVSNFHYSIDHLSDETSWGFVASLIGIVWRGFAHSYHSVSEATSMGASFLTIGFALFFGIQFKESKLSEACSVAGRAAEKRQDFIDSDGSEPNSKTDNPWTWRRTYGKLLVRSSLVAIVTTLICLEALYVACKEPPRSAFLNYRLFAMLLFTSFALHQVTALSYKSYRANLHLFEGKRLLYLSYSNLIVLTLIITTLLTVMIMTCLNRHFFLLICETCWLLLVALPAFPIISWNKTLLSRMICRSLTIEVIRRYRTATYFKDELSRYN